MAVLYMSVINLIVVFERGSMSDLALIIVVEVKSRFAVIVMQVGSQGTVKLVATYVVQSCSSVVRFTCCEARLVLFGLTVIDR